MSSSSSNRQARIQAIASDAALSPQEKQARIHAIYSEAAQSFTASGRAGPAAIDPAKCKHYLRGANVLAKCCNGAVFPCRLCHDAVSDHELKSRTQVDEMQCRKCNLVQPVARTCMRPDCEWNSTLYFCEACRLWNDDEAKKIFHCEDCGICRVGKREEYFHCHSCHLCQPSSIKETHKCLQLAVDEACPACQDALHSSSIAVQTMDCGHAMHSKCITKLLRSGSRQCPKCRKTIQKDPMYEASVREAIASTPMPPEYSRVQVEVQCNDCSAKSVVAFHVFGAVCQACLSVNTARLRTIQPSAEDKGALPSA